MGKNNLEDVFKSGFAGEQEAYQQSDWDKMSQLLDTAGPAPAQQPAANGKRRLLLGLLALLLISGAVWVTVSRNAKKQPVLAQKDTASQTGRAGTTRPGTGDAGSTDAGTISGSSTTGNAQPFADTLSGTAVSDTVASWKYDTTYVSTGQPYTGGRQNRSVPATGNNTGRRTLTNRDHMNQPGIRGVDQPDVDAQYDQTATMKVRKTKVTTINNRDSKNGSGNTAKITKQAADAVRDEEVLDEKAVPVEHFNNRLQEVTAKPVKADAEAKRPTGTQDTAAIMAGHNDTTAANATKSMLNAADSLLLSVPVLSSNSKKEKKVRGFGRKVLGLPQWISAGYTMTPVASAAYYFFDTQSGTTYPFGYFPYDSAGTISSGTRGFHVAIGSEWYAFKSNQWSLNSFVMLQYAPARHISKSTRVQYGTGYTQYDTISDLRSLTALRLGTEMTWHSRNKRLQAGVGLNIQYLGAGRGNRNYYENTWGGGISSIGNKSWGLFNGIRRWNPGLSAHFNYRITGPLMLDIRAGADLLDMTSDSYYRNSMRNNLSHYAVGLKLNLGKTE